MSIPESSDKSTAPPKRELPQFAIDFANSLRRRRGLYEPMSGGTTADRHRDETGHPLYKGCCSDPANRCAGCRKVLPREAKVRGELYCSKSCREAATNG